MVQKAQISNLLSRGGPNTRKYSLLKVNESRVYQADIKCGSAGAAATIMSPETVRDFRSDPMEGSGYPPIRMGKPHYVCQVIAIPTLIFQPLAADSRQESPGPYFNPPIQYTSCPLMVVCRTDNEGRKEQMSSGSGRLCLPASQRSD